MEIQIIKILVLIILPLWLIADFTIRFGGWKIRKNVMKKLAKKLNLEFIEKNGHKIHYALTGNYLGKKISIEEFSVVPNFRLSGSGIGEGSGGHVLFGNKEIAKKLIINVDNKIIYQKNGARLFPHPYKIKKVIDNYINSGIIPKKISLVLATLLFFISCIIFIILFSIFILPKLII